MKRKNNIIDKIINSLIDNEIILMEDKEIYYYGLEQGILIIINLATVFFIGAILDMLWQSILFMTAYIPLRIYAGGYHSDNRINCYFFSIVIMLFTLTGLKKIDLMNLSIIISLSLSAIIIYILAPIESKNKILKEKEKNIYKNRTRLILLAEVVFALFFVVIWKREIANVILMAIIMVSIMLVLGKIKNIRYNYAKEKDID